MGFSKTGSMQFLANVVRLVPKKLLFLCPVAMLSLSIPLSVASSAKAQEYTSVVCDFQKPTGGSTWQWGLNKDNSWFKLGGSWQAEGTYRFSTEVPRDKIVASCEQSKGYYGHSDKTLVGVFAANSSTGSNYAIYVKGQEVKP
jgi:hypothetical protein